ncbi:DUF6397 family protein [Streptomyces sp. NRRL F-5135]|uniref:DUF6397 family protein n=1 Tax=Streptomyces sp. NRRL F-5135 TaxID=1463858 RepID=UPI0006921EE3|nr:DUF6397 family protein [Streptomyces sp. NRRL F-5135]
MEEAAESPAAVGIARAAQELCLRRGEFELAAELGHVRTIAGPVAGRRQVSRREIDRLRAAEGFPDALRERVRTVGTAEGAELMLISPGRFGRLARAGFITPVRFYLNRYRAIVWLYLADELRQFAERERTLLSGRFPKGLDGGTAAGRDLRARNWRGRRIGRLLHECAGPWERAAVVAGVLDPAQLAELVPDPYERAYVRRLMPELSQVHPQSETARGKVRRLLVADDPDEIQWHRAGLTLLLETARCAHPAPRPDEVPPDDRGADAAARSPVPPSDENVPTPPSDAVAPPPAGPGPSPHTGRETVTSPRAPVAPCGDGRAGLLARLGLGRSRRPRVAARPR